MVQPYSIEIQTPLDSLCPRQDTNYIDDLIGNATVSQAEPAFQKLYKLLQELGLTISDSKLVTPTTKCVCLGIVVDPSIPPFLSHSKKLPKY